MHEIQNNQNFSDAAYAQAEASVIESFVKDFISGDDDVLKRIIDITDISENEVKES